MESGSAELRLALDGEVSPCVFGQIILSRDVVPVESTPPAEKVM